jgi:hypothetical protein
MVRRQGGLILISCSLKHIESGEGCGFVHTALELKDHIDAHRQTKMITHIDSLCILQIDLGQVCQMPTITISESYSPLVSPFSTTPILGGMMPARLNSCQALLVTSVSNENSCLKSLAYPFARMRL